MSDSPDAAAAPRTRPTRRPPTLLERLVGRGPDLQLISVVMIFGLGVLAVGLGEVSGSFEWGFTWDGAFNGVVGELAYTATPAVLMALATTANVLAGAIALRFLGTPAFRSLSDLILAGFAAAVVLDTAALFLLGSFGFFGWPELLALHLGALAAYLATRQSRPLMAIPVRFRPRRPAVWWLLVGAIWAGPLIVQLASPAAPFFDVLPNHVAPAEHARVFGSFATLTTSPSPIYGPSRLMLGYVGLLGQLTTIANLEAILSVAAFAFPLTILTAVSMRQLASHLFGANAGFWILLTFPLTFTFMRLPDTRGTVVAFPLAAFALGVIAQELRAARAARAGAGQGGIRTARFPQPDLALAAAVGGAILVHPLIGIVAATAAVGLLLLEPRRLAPRLIPALGAGAVIAIPQAMTMLGLGAPSWVGFVCVAAAIPVAFGLAWAVQGAIGFVFGRLRIPGGMLRVDQVFIVVGAILIALVVAREYIHPPYDDPANELMANCSRLLAITLIGVALGRRHAARGWIVLGCGIAAGLIAWAASGLVGNATLTQQAIHYEVPKSVEYWLPVMLALGAAGGIAAVWRLRRVSSNRVVALVSLPLVVFSLMAFVFVTVSPYPGPLITNDQIGEHRGSESLGLALREAELGYWSGFPDSRQIIDPSEQQVVDALRGEIDAGRLGPSTHVLHLASSFQQSVSVPIGVFTGALETSISLEPELSIHTEGGRLLGFDVLAGELASSYGYVVLEPDGLDPGLADQIAAAGYHQIWSNSKATIFARN